MSGSCVARRSLAEEGVRLAEQGLSSEIGEDRASLPQRSFRFVPASEQRQGSTRTEKRMRALVHEAEAPPPIRRLGVQAARFFEIALDLGELGSRGRRRVLVTWDGRVRPL